MLQYYLAIGEGLTVQILDVLMSAHGNPLFSNNQQWMKPLGCLQMINSGRIVGSTSCPRFWIRTCEPPGSVSSWSLFWSPFATFRFCTWQSSDVPRVRALHQRSHQSMSQYHHTEQTLQYHEYHKLKTNIFIYLFAKTPGRGRFHLFMTLPPLLDYHR